MQQEIKSKLSVLGLKALGLVALLVWAYVSFYNITPLLEATFIELQNNGSVTYFDFVNRLLTKPYFYFTIGQVSLIIFLAIKLIKFK